MRQKANLTHVGFTIEQNSNIFRTVPITRTFKASCHDSLLILQFNKSMADSAHNTVSIARAPRKVKLPARFSR